jgi:hypothetical protein
LETLHERPESTGRYFHPESILPYPKETIRAALVLVFEIMERDQLQQFAGVSKDVYLVTEHLLGECFAPDEEAPDDPDLASSPRRPPNTMALCYLSVLRPRTVGRRPLHPCVIAPRSDPTSGS